MVGFVISHAWSSYYASSPFKNFLDIPAELQVGFRIIHMHDWMVTDPETIRTILSFDALVVDDVYAPHMGFYKNGPKLLIDGDPHRNKKSEVDLLEAKYRWADYILTSADPKLTVSGRFYPSQDLRENKFTYYPHSAPAIPLKTKPWLERDPRTLLSGSRGKAVYPFRAAVEESNARSVASLHFQSKNHESYFAEIAKYRGAVTCHSIFHYTVAKYFEIPWLGTLLIGQSLSQEEQELLGFKHNENCLLPSTAREAISLANSVTSSPLAFEGIAAEGQNLIMRRHTIHHRIKYILKLIEAIQSGGFKNTYAKEIFKGMKYE